MSLVHHLNSTTPYEDTAKAASEQAKTKLQAIINKGKEKALNKSAWRFSNVLSLMAQSAGGDKKIDLERAAMEVLK